MKKYHVEFDILIADDATAEQVEEWARYMCGDKGSMKENNPLIKKSFDPQFGSFVIKEKK